MEFAMNKNITIVSGLPRSGTSMMMRMLQAGSSLELLVDNIRSADADNPQGYFEYEKVKKLLDDATWLDDAVGKVVKVVSMLLYHLPDTYTYRVVFMQRHMQEILASQQKMLVRRHEKSATDDNRMAELYLQHLAEVRTFLGNSKNITTCNMSFNKLLTNPEPELDRLADFFNGNLDRDATRKVIDPDLYRSKSKIH
jgi:hypothetical protein